MANPHKHTKFKVELGPTFKDNAGYLVYTVVPLIRTGNDGNQIAQFRGPEAEGNALRMIEFWNRAIG